MVAHATFTRRQALGTLAAGTALATLPGCATTGTLTASDATTAMLDAVAWRLLVAEPERATSLGVDTGDKSALRSASSGTSPAALHAETAMLRTDLAFVSSLPRQHLDAPTRTSLDVVESAYATAIQGLELPYGSASVGGWRNSPYAVIQNVGGYIDMPRFLDSDQPVDTADDAEAYLARLSAFPAQLDGELERLQQARRQGLVPPTFLLIRAIAQMEQSIADAAAGGSMVESLTRRTAEHAIPGQWQARAEEVVKGPVLAALQRQLAELQAEAALATSEAGMWSRPHGDEYYAWALKAATTTTLTPAEIHQIGLDQLAEIHSRMDAILRPLGYTSGSVGQRMVQLGEDPRFKFAEGDPGRAEIMAFIHERIDWIRAQMPRAFLRQVPARLEVRRLPLAEEPGAPTAYGGSGSKDGRIPGKMWLNLRTTDLHRQYGLPTLVHHETIPGHVWEGEYSNQLSLIRSVLSFSAFSEGWALYAEVLADELGAYDEHPEWRLGYLSDQAYRAARLVVDTGMHAMQWSRQRAFDFFQQQVGQEEGEVANEIDRYCSWPGQACAYKIGQTQILRLRDSARTELGDRYDLRAFNQAVVDGGNCPLDVLAGNVDRYIAGARG